MAAALLPFLWLDGRLFLSSTVLFYLANHAGGDKTALAYFLPAWGRAAFAVIGALAGLGIPLLAARHRHQDALAPAAPGYAAFAVFTTFAPGSHLNYL